MFCVVLLTEKKDAKEHLYALLIKMNDKKCCISVSVQCVRAHVIQ